MMCLCSITAIFGIAFFAFVSHALPVTNENDAALYLKTFGYIEESADQETSLNQESIESAIRDFQKFAGIPETGELDNETISMMNMPRCGVKDKIRHTDSHRKKRYALQGSKWRIKDLTYRISKYPSIITDSAIVRSEISRAFKIWSDVTTLTFTEKRHGPVHIDIRFEVGDHGDGDAFDGPGNTLAHAFFPRYGGDAHFDDEETWTINGYRGINLFQVAAHEFGHSLGLSHTEDEPLALMAPFYRYIPEFPLHSDDIEGIQALYGSPDAQPPFDDLPTPPDDEDFEPPPDADDVPDLCQDATLDAITRIKNGSTYVFKGDFYWEVLPNGLSKGYPRKISDDWDGLPGNLNAAVTFSNGRTYFFKGRHYWRFTNKKKNGGFPKLISAGFEGIPDMLDAAFVWSKNGKTYFFKGDKYWLYDTERDSPVSWNYPMSITKWSGMLSGGIDAAFKWYNNRTYFFKGDQYYRINDVISGIDEGNPSFPRPTATWWFGCQYHHNAATEGTETQEQAHRYEENTINYDFSDH